MTMHASSPRVTVVIPTYRRPRLLADALASVLAGSYSDFEVLVANDGVEEDLAPVRAQFPDPRIKWITRPDRLGMLANHVDAFRRAKGDFVANLDDDDSWTPRLLSTLVPILERHRDVSVAFADHFVVDGAGVVDPVQTEINSQRWGRAQLSEGPHHPFAKLAAIDRSIPMQCAAVFRRNALRLADYSESVDTCWDVWTAYLLAKEGGTAWYVPERLAFYRAHGGSATVTGRAASARSAIYCWERFLDDEALSTWRSDLEPRLVGAHFRLAIELLCARTVREGSGHARSAVAIGVASPVSTARFLVRRRLDRRYAAARSKVHGAGVPAADR